MGDSSIEDHQLVAYVDGELNSAEEVLAIEKAIREDHRLESKVMAYRASSDFLKKGLNTTERTVSAHTIMEIRKIEQKILQKKQIDDESLSTSQNRRWSLVNFLYDFVNLRINNLPFSTGVISGSLLSGAICAILVISLGVIQPDNISYSKTGSNSDVIGWRGPSDTILSGYAIQDGLQIQSGGTINASVTFKLVLQSSIPGKYQIFEQADGAESEIKGFTGIMQKDLPITTKGLIIKEQDTLKVGIKLSNEDLTVTKIFTFDVARNNTQYELHLNK